MSSTDQNRGIILAVEQDVLKLIADRREAIAAELARGQAWMSALAMEDARLRITEEVLTEINGAQLPLALEEPDIVPVSEAAAPKKITRGQMLEAALDRLGARTAPVEITIKALAAEAGVPAGRVARYRSADEVDRASA